MFPNLEGVRNRLAMRRAKGRGRRVWFPVMAVALLVGFWMAPGAEGRAEQRASRFHVAKEQDRSLADLAAELRAHPSWAARAGLTVADADRIAGVLDEKSALFDAYRDRRKALKARAAEVFGAAVIDADQLVALREETRRLATEEVDETLMLSVQVLEGLSPDQRTKLLDYWGDR